MRLTPTAMLVVRLSGIAPETAKQFEEKTPHRQRATDDLVMVARFYHPSFAGAARALSEQADDLEKGIRSFEDALVSPDRPDVMELMRPVVAARDGLRQSVKAFQDSLAHAAFNFI